MFCIYCGKQIDTTSKFCPHCGKKIEKPDISETKSIQKPIEEQKKTYGPIFWKYFWIAFLLNIIAEISEEVESGLFSLLYLLILGVYVYFFCKMINEAMLSIRKKDWWPLGLLVLIPFGFWITFFVVRAQLKPRGRWNDERKSFKLSKDKF